MLFTEAVFVGIDPTAGTKPMQLVALDRELRLVAMERDDLESLLAIIASFESAVVAVDAPQGPNCGLMRRPEIRQRFNLRPGGRTWSGWRVCEYELRRRNIRLYNTPEEVERAKPWVRMGFRLFGRLEELGFTAYRQGEDPKPRLMLEARAHAGYATLLERRPFLKHSFEGRMQRQLVLYLEGVDLPNPMQALEELTRHHLLTGHLPLEELHTPEELDALMGAYTAYLVAARPEGVCQVGKAEEGLITLPVAELKDFYA